MAAVSIIAERQGAAAYRGNSNGRQAEVLMYNQCYGSEKEVISQFNEVRKLNPKLASPVLHITLSLSPGENLPTGKLMEMCEDCAKDLGLKRTSTSLSTIRHYPPAPAHCSQQGRLR